MKNSKCNSFTVQEETDITHSVQESRRKTSFKRFRKSFKEYVREFCESVSIQGLALMVQDISLLERIWWILVFTAGVSGSFFMVNNLLDKYRTTPVLVSLATQESSISEIPFPAVTICPETKIAAKCINYTKILQDRKKEIILASELGENFYFDLMAVFCKSENHKVTTEALLRKKISNSSEKISANKASSANDSNEVSLEDYSGFLAYCSAVKLEDAICKWMGRTVKCEDVLFPVLTDEGLCYSFNMYDVRDIYSDLNTMEYYPERNNRRCDWNPDDGYRKNITDLKNVYPRIAYRSGANNGFTAIFFTKKEDINYACQDFSTQGLRVSLHQPTRLARPGQVFFTVGLDQVATAAVIPSSTSTAKKIQSYAPNKRGCFFGRERQLKYFKFYTQANCNLECWTNYTQHQCGCVNFYMPRDNETEICKLKKRSCIVKARKSYTGDILKERIESKKSDGTKTCHCLPLCSDMIYNAEVSTSDWDFTNEDEVFFDDARDVVSLFHTSAVKVFFKKDFFLPTRRSELYGTTDLISNIGGTLGLFMGFSLISLSEIIYFLSVRIIDNYRKYGYWAGPRHP